MQWCYSAISQYFYTKSREQVWEHHGQRIKMNDIRVIAQQGEKKCCNNFSNAEIPFHQMFLSRHGLITLAPTPLIITCHQQQRLHLFARLSEMPAQLTSKKTQLLLLLDPRCGKLTINLPMSRAKHFTNFSCKEQSTTMGVFCHNALPAWIL